MATAELPASIRLLLVDDDNQLTDMYSLHLKVHGYSVFTARSGEEALNLAAEVSPHLVVLDLGLPGIGGLEVLERLRGEAATASIPVVVLSNYSEPKLVEQSLKMGASDYLVKAHTTPAHLTAAMLRWSREIEPD